MIVNSLFYFFSCILILSSLMIILSQNSIYSVLFLVLSFVSSSSIMFLLECEYISLIFIIIYVGAIAVLFLFVVMMLDIKTVYLVKDSLKYFPFGSFLGIVFLFFLCRFRGRLCMWFYVIYFYLGFWVTDRLLQNLFFRL